MQNQIKQLKDELQRDFPRSEPKLTLFPSGSAMLDVKIGIETYVLEYHLDVGLGINRMSKATYGWEGYEYPFGNFDEAKDYLFSLLRKQQGSY
jgi:hypothetical protein